MGMRTDASGYRSVDASEVGHHRGLTIVVVVVVVVVSCRCRRACGLGGGGCVCVCMWDSHVGRVVGEWPGEVCEVKGEGECECRGKTRTGGRAGIAV